MAQGSWSGLFRIGFFQVLCSVESTALPLGFLLVPGFWQFKVWAFYPQNHPLFATQAYILLIGALLDGDVLPLVIFPHRPEMMPIYLWNSMKVLIWRTRLLMGLRKRCSLGLGCWWNRQISESSPSSENSDIIHFRCQACSLKTLEVEEEKEINERHNSTGPGGSGSGVKWDSAWHFAAIAEQKCLVTHTEAGRRVYRVPGVPRKVSCRVAGVACCKLGWLTDFILSLKIWFIFCCAGSLLLCAGIV